MHSPDFSEENKETLENFEKKYKQKMILRYRTFIFSQPTQKKVKSNSLDVSYVYEKEVNSFKMMNQMELNEFYIN